ncbi:hypothetical protein PLACP1_31250 [Planifilum fimeticola]
MRDSCGLYINLDETGQIYNPWENYDPVTLMLSIDVNIYAPLLNETEQSLETARMNAPILKVFFEAIGEGATIRINRSRWTVVYAGVS